MNEDLKGISIAFTVGAVVCGLAIILAWAEHRYRAEQPVSQVETVLVHDGCTVYRFKDSGKLQYFTKCATENPHG